MFRTLRNTLIRRGLQTAAQIGVDAAATATTRSFIQVFKVTLPVTVFVRGSSVDVQVRYVAGTQVELQANLRASFGWEFVTDQDEAGVYIVARRKPIVGAIASASFNLKVPPEAHLALHVTPGSVRLYDIDGKLTVPGHIAS
jgi:hypothetical protein